MGIILGALAGAGEGMASAGQTYAKTGADEDLAAKRAALEQTTQQNLLNYKQQMLINERNRVGGIVNAVRADGGDDNAVRTALINSGDIDQAKTIGDMSNKTELAQIKANAQEQLAKYQGDITTIKQELANSNSKFNDLKGLYWASKNEQSGLNDAKAAELNMKDIDRVFGNRINVLSKALDPSNPKYDLLAPDKQKALQTDLAVAQSLQAAAQQIARENPNISGAKAASLAIAVGNRSITPVDNGKGQYVIPVNGQRGVPMPESLLFMVSPQAAPKIDPNKNPRITLLDGNPANAQSAEADQTPTDPYVY